MINPSLVHWNSASMIQITHFWELELSFGAGSCNRNCFKHKKSLKHKKWFCLLSCHTCLNLWWQQAWISLPEPTKKFLWPSALTCHRGVLCFFLPTATLCWHPLGFRFLSLNSSIYSRQQQNQGGDVAVSLPVLLFNGQSFFIPTVAQCKRWAGEISGIKKSCQGRNNSHSQAV